MDLGQKSSPLVVDYFMSTNSSHPAGTPLCNEVTLSPIQTYHLFLHPFESGLDPVLCLNQHNVAEMPQYESQSLELKKP